MSESLKGLLEANEKLEADIDASDRITPEQCEAHFQSMASIDEKVEKVLTALDICKMNAAHMSTLVSDFKARAEHWENRVEDLEGYLLWLLERFPEVEGRGTTRTIKARINQPRFKCGLVKKFSKDNFVPVSNVPDIPLEYLERMEIFVLRADKAKDDLKAGKQIDFARLEQSKTLKITPKDLINAKK